MAWIRPCLRPWERYNWNPKNGESSPNLVLNWRIVAFQRVNERSLVCDFTYRSQFKRIYSLIDLSPRFSRYKNSNYCFARTCYFELFFFLKRVREFDAISFNPIQIRDYANYSPLEFFNRDVSHSQIRNRDKR